MIYGNFDYERYDVVENRINQFDNVNIIGKDETGNYDMYSIELGKPDGPPILITAGVHGQETETTQYSLYFMEYLRDDNFPDKDFMDFLLNHFKIVYLPVLNPWGMDNIPDPYIRIGSDHYRNVNQVDINRDFVNQSQQETRNVVSVMDNHDYFAHLDLHMMYPGYNLVDHENFVVANEREETKPIQHDFADAWEIINNQDVARWDLRGPGESMVRGYSINKENTHTPYTLPMMTEIMRPTWWNGDFVERLTNSEIFYNGFASLYSFLNESMNYYYLNNSPQNTNIGTRIIRDSDGLAKKSIEHLEFNRTIEKELNRDDDGYVESIESVMFRDLLPELTFIENSWYVDGEQSSHTSVSTYEKHDYRPGDEFEITRDSGDASSFYIQYWDENMNHIDQLNYNFVDNEVTITDVPDDTAYMAFVFWNEVENPKVLLKLGG